MEYSEHKLIIDRREYEDLVEARDSFEDLSVKYGEVTLELKKAKRDINNHDTSLNLTASRLMKCIEALQTIKLASDGKKTLNNASINKICTDALNFKI